MDVLVLIDKLDDLVHQAKAVPLTDQVRIDREEIYDILDQMRATIPEEIKQARWIVKERQEMLAEAKRETDRLLGEAREQAVRVRLEHTLQGLLAYPTGPQGSHVTTSMLGARALAPAALTPPTPGAATRSIRPMTTCCCAMLHKLVVSQ